MMGAPIDNTGGGPLVRDTGFRDFDRLPAGLRRYFAEAPYDYAVTTVARAVRTAERKCGSRLLPDQIEGAVSSLLKTAADDVAANAFALYGAAHPQARAMLRATLKRMKLLDVYDANAKWHAP